MAVVERTIIAGGGGNYTTVAAWEAAANLNGGADIWKGVISDNSAYDEAVTFDAGGSPTINSYLWLTVAVANRHAGVYDTGKARLDYTGATTAVIQLDSSYSRVEWQQFRRSTSFDSSDEGIRVNSNATNCLIEYNVFFADAVERHADAVYTMDGTGPTFISNNVAYNWGRAGINSQQVGARTIYSDHNTLILCASSSSSDLYGIVSGSFDGDLTMHAYNTIAVENVQNAGVEWGTLQDGTLTLNGSHNVATSATHVQPTTNNATNWVYAPDEVVSVAPATGGVYITDDTIATLDATPVDHINNVILGAGTNRQGSEPDPRQDFSVAINGSRPTANVDIGAFQISVGTGPNTGTGTTTVNLTLTATGEAPAQGTATLTIDLAAAANGQTASTGTGVAPIDLTIAATGQATTQGTAALTVDLATTAAGNAAGGGQADLPININTTATGTTAHSGQAAALVDLSTQATGQTEAAGTGSHPINLTITAVGAAPGLGGTGSLPIDIITTATGGRTSDGAGASIVDIATTATGQTTADGTAATPINLTLTAQGSSGGTGTAATPINLTLTATGEAPGGGSANYPVDVTLAATGTRGSSGLAATPADLVLTATGQATHSGSAALTVDLALAATTIPSVIGEVVFIPDDRETVTFTPNNSKAVAFT